MTETDAGSKASSWTYYDIGRSTTSSTVFYTFDPQGSVAQRLTSSGVASSDCYNAWGIASTTASTSDAFGFGGQWGYYTDSEAGLILCGHRYYDQAAGKWLTRDPIGYEGGVNLYGYADSAPTDAVDPTCYCPACVGVVVSGIVSGIANGYNGGHGWNWGAFGRGFVEGLITGLFGAFGPILGAVGGMIVGAYEACRTHSSLGGGVLIGGIFGLLGGAIPAPEVWDPLEDVLAYLGGSSVMGIATYDTGIYTTLFPL